jgi:hypothetical protein
MIVSEDSAVTVDPKEVKNEDVQAVTVSRVDSSSLIEQDAADLSSSQGESIITIDAQDSKNSVESGRSTHEKPVSKEPSVQSNALVKSVNRRSSLQSHLTFTPAVSPDTLLQGLSRFRFLMIE